MPSRISELTYNLLTSVKPAYYHNRDTAEINDRVKHS